MKVFYGMVVVVALAVVAFAVFDSRGGSLYSEAAPIPAAAVDPSTERPVSTAATEGVDRDARRSNVDIMPVIPGEIYDPVAAGEPTPPDYRQVLPRDAILPIYNPRFVSAVDAGWTDDTLIIGLELDGEAKAYPVSFLNRREMVIDWIAGTPVLVSW